MIQQKSKKEEIHNNIVIDIYYTHNKLNFSLEIKNNNRLMIQLKRKEKLN